MLRWSTATGGEVTHECKHKQLQPIQVTFSSSVAGYIRNWLLYSAAIWSSPGTQPSRQHPLLVDPFLTEAKARHDCTAGLNSKLGVPHSIGHHQLRVFRFTVGQLHLINSCNRPPQSFTPPELVHAHTNNNKNNSNEKIHEQQYKSPLE